MIVERQRLSNRQARAVARDIRAAHPGWSVVVFPLAQGVARVDVRLPDGQMLIVRSAAEAAQLAGFNS